MCKKKLIATILSTMMILSLAGCGNLGDEQQSIAPKDTIDYVDSESNGILANDNSGNNNYTNESYSDDYVEPDFNTEEYDNIEENGFIKVGTQPLSTFAADVDTGSYCNFRRMINDNMDKDSISSGAIRTEEMINYFDYDVEGKSDGKFTVNSEVQTCPWNEDNKLLMLTVQANDVEVDNNGNNFVFLIDTSGSMTDDGKAKLVTKSFKALAESLNENDKVSIVTYAGDTDVLLEGCDGDELEKIKNALDEAEELTFNYGGGTNGSGGIEKAYEIAEDYFIKGGNNRVIIASDGDMNLGVTSNSELVDLIKEKKESGVFLTTLGYGSGNYSDSNMESIADAGNGNYYYIDCLDEAKHILVEKLKETTVTVAKDVKMQVEFNPNYISEYRLIGYENRVMNADDFEDDTKDGGEVGAGQQVTVCYELVLGDGNNGKDLKYQDNSTLSDAAYSNEILTLSVNYKEVDEDKSQTEEYPILDEEKEMSEDFSFVVGVIETSMIVRDSEYKGTSTIKDAIEYANNGSKDNEYREEFAKLIKNLDD